MGGVKGKLDVSIAQASAVITKRAVPECKMTNAYCGHVISYCQFMGNSNHSNLQNVFNEFTSVLNFTYVHIIRSCKCISYHRFQKSFAYLQVTVTLPPNITNHLLYTIIVHHCRIDLL